MKKSEEDFPVPMFNAYLLKDIEDKEKRQRKKEKSLLFQLRKLWQFLTGIHHIKE